MLPDDTLGRRRALEELAARKGLDFVAGPLAGSPLTLHFIDKETGALVFSSPSYEHAYGYLQTLPDRPSPA